MELLKATPTNAPHESCTLRAVKVRLILTEAEMKAIDGIKKSNTADRDALVNGRYKEDINLYFSAYESDFPDANVIAGFEKQIQRLEKEIEVANGSFRTVLAQQLHKEGRLDVRSENGKQSIGFCPQDKSQNNHVPYHQAREKMTGDLYVTFNGRVKLPEVYKAQLEHCRDLMQEANEYYWLSVEMRQTAAVLAMASEEDRQRIVDVIDQAKAMFISEVMAEDAQGKPANAHN